MTYTDRQINESIRVARNKIFRSAGLSAILGMVVLYIFSQGKFGSDISSSALLFCGFIVGFFIAGIVVPQSFLQALKNESAKKVDSASPKT